MFELIVRTVLAVGLLIGSGVSGVPPFDVAWRLAAFFGTYSFLAYAMEHRGIRNAGVSGLFAVVDAAVIVAALSAAGGLTTLGFLALFPLAYAATRFQSDPLAMAPIGSAWILVGSNLFRGPGWTPAILGQACGVLAIGVLGARAAKVVTVKEYVEVATGQTDPEPIPEEFFELRENYRKVRDRARDLERKGRRAQIVASVFDALSDPVEDPLARVARGLCETLKVGGLTLYSTDHAGDALIVQSASGTVPERIIDESFPVPDFSSEWQLRDRLDLALSALRSPEDEGHVGSVVLKDKGRIVGLLALYDKSSECVQAAREAAQESADDIARSLKSAQAKRTQRQRLREAETLYLAASASLGAETPTTLAARLCREFYDRGALDCLAVYFSQDDELAVAAIEGNRMRILDSLQLDDAEEPQSWLALGGPEVVVLDARNDPRIAKEDSIKNRIGSLAVLPLAFDERVTGCLIAGTHRVQGLTQESVESLRLLASELALGIARIESPSSGPSGLANPAEFHDAVRGRQDGRLVYFEVLRRDELIERFGLPALEQALQRLSSRLRAQLPAGGLVCRRQEGDFIAFVRTDDEEFARLWAGRVAAQASLVCLASADGRHKAPLAVRAKVATIAPQTHQISQEVAS